MTDLRRIILEIGTGNDLYGEDVYSRSKPRGPRCNSSPGSIIMFRSLGLDPAKMIVNVTIGVENLSWLTVMPLHKPYPVAKQV